MSQNQQSRQTNRTEIESNIANPEVRMQAERRRFTTEYKLKNLEEAEGCKEPGEVGALLRREGLYDSHLGRWRKAKREGRLGGGQKKQKVAKKVKELESEVSRLEAENGRLQKALEQAELVLDVQKKVSQLLGLGARAAGATDGNGGVTQS